MEFFNKNNDEEKSIEQDFLKIVDSKHPAYFILVWVKEKHGPLVNKIWIKNKGKKQNHWLYKNWKIGHNMCKKFLNTSCEITASVIRSALNTPDIWDNLPTRSLARERAIFTGIFVYQVEYGVEIGDIDHILSIIVIEDDSTGNSDIVIESWWNKFELRNVSFLNHKVNGYINAKPYNYSNKLSVKDDIKSIFFKAPPINY